MRTLGEGSKNWDSARKIRRVGKYDLSFIYIGNLIETQDLALMRNHK